jgi:hypothetical protein
VATVRRDGFDLHDGITVGNGFGSTTAVSPLTGVVGGATSTSPPMNLSPPTISGTAQEGQTLRASTGSWSGSPTGYSYEWRRCDTSGGSCTALVGASSSSYAAQSADIGSTLRVAVTASNASGTAAAVSEPSAIVAAARASPPTPAGQTVTFSGSLNPKNPSRSFSVSVGAGMAHAGLAFTRAARAPSASLQRCEHH